MTSLKLPRIGGDSASAFFLAEVSAQPISGCGGGLGGVAGCEWRGLAGGVLLMRRWRFEVVLREGCAIS
jgi:hypothetical protein